MPEDDFVDRCVNLLDAYHDESHVREYRPREWERMLAAAGFEVEAVQPYIVHRPLTAYTEGASAENARRIRDVVNGLTAGEKALLNLTERDGQVHLDHWFVMVSARG